MKEILIGKAKEDFLEFLKKDYNHLLVKMGDSKTYLYDLLLSSHVKKTDVLLSSVIIEWFDSVGIYISIDPQKEFKNVYFDVSVNFELHSVWGTRQQAITAAIEKSVEIYNLNN